MKKSVLTASACALLLAGCIPISRGMDKTLLDFQGKAHIMTIDDEWFSRSRPCQIVPSGSQSCGPIVQMIDGAPQPQVGRQSLGVVPGAHTFVVAVPWSNGWQDQTELTFEAQGRKRYWILTYELAPGEPEETAEIRRYTDGEVALHEAEAVTIISLASPVVYAAGLLILPYEGYRGVRKLLRAEKEEEKKEPATSRPFERCCFVWVQEEESGAVVAGERPGGGTPP